MEHLSELWHCSGLRTFLGVYKINLIMCILACFVWLVTRACRSAAATSCAQSDCACTTGGGATSERVACFSTQCTRMGGLAAVVCSFNLYVFLYQSNQVFTTALKFISATPYSHVATERIGYSVLVCFASRVRKYCALGINPIVCVCQCRNALPEHRPPRHAHTGR